MADALYLVAIIPPEPVYGQINRFKEIFDRDYPGFKKSIAVLPHITLFPPLHQEENTAAFLIHDLTELSRGCMPFPIQISGFNHFSNHTIYADVIPSFPLVNLFDLFAQGGRPAKPHLTIGYQNKDEATFQQAWASFKDRPYEASFTVESFWLLRFNNGWKGLQEIPLRK